MKNNFNFKLANLGIISFILFVLCFTLDIWLGLAIKIINILIPFVIAFAFAYLFYPLLKFMEKHKIPKMIGIIIILALTIGAIYLTIISLIPLIVDQSVTLFDNLTTFINDMAVKYDINLSLLTSKVSSIEDIVNNYSKEISNGAISIINIFISIITISIISLIVGCFFLVEMDDIRNSVKTFLLKINKRTFNYIKKLDYEIRQYFIGFGQFTIIQLFEYLIVYYLIGHPYYLIMAFLAAFSGIIPLFGGMIAGFLAVISGFSISMNLGIMTTIVVIICSNIDGYVISPLIFQKTNKISTLLIIFSVFALGGLFGIIGVITALPLTIILVNTYRFYRQDILKALKRKK